MAAPTDIELPLGKRTFFYRTFEIFPGFLSWFIIFLPFTLSLINTTLAAYFILLFIISWFYRAVGIAYLTVKGYNAMKAAQAVNWQARLNDLQHPEKALVRYHDKTSESAFAKEHYQNLLKYVGHTEKLQPSQVTNAIIVPMWNESFEVVEPTIDSIVSSQYPMDQVILLIAYEERGGEAAKQTVKQILSKYKNKFKYIDAIEHPDGLEGEVVGKGGNITFAGRKLQKYLAQNKIDPGTVIVTTLDADNRLDPAYLANVTYSYIIEPERRYRSFQPIAMYINNIWDVPAPMRVLATGNSFWTVLQSVRPHLLRNFSSHSQGMDSLIDMDFWSTRTIVEDGHQYWRSYFRYNGNYAVVPIHIPVYQDAVLSDSYRKTLKAQFVQFQRWAYGVSDIPYIAVRGFRLKKNRQVPFWDFFFKFLRLLEGHVSQATVSLILFFAARVPLLVGHQADKSIIAHQLPVIVSYAETIAMSGIFISIFFSMKMLPPRPARYKKRRTFVMVIQWILLPVVAIIYGSMASLYSQTKLMLGSYLDKFVLTEKVVRGSRVKTTSK